MLHFESEIDGKHAQIDLLRTKLKNYGLCLGGYPDYDRGFFDVTLSKQEDATIYLRLPFVVISGMFETDNAHIEFQTPYVIKQMAKGSLDFDESTLLDAHKFRPFQNDEDIRNEHKWVRAGEQIVGKLLQYIH